MDMISLSPDRYAEWDQFCLESDEAWFNHISTWIEYTLNMKLEPKNENKSFMVYENNELIAICPLVIEINRFKKEFVKEFSYSGFLTPTPALKNGLSKKSRKKVLDFIFKAIDRYALLNGVKRSLFMIYPLSHHFLDRKESPYNFLQKYGYTDISINTQLLNISLSLEDIKKEIRKGHKYDVNRGLKSFKIEIWNSENINNKVFEQYRLLHKKAAGKITRAAKTFEIMFEWIKNDNSILVSARLRDKFVGFGIVNIYKEFAYFQSACNDPDFKNIPITHALQWKTIEYLKNKGIQYYELGWQYSKGISFEVASKKELDISKFKRGFGGFTVPLFRGEKFYSYEYMEKTMKERMQKLKERMV